MYTSGQFAEIMGTTIRTIRYYDKIGILSAHRNLNGYRYYAEDQKNDYLTIKTLQLLGFSLEEIGQYKDSLTEQILRKKQLQLKEQFHQLQESIHIIDEMKEHPSKNRDYYSKLYQDRELSTTQVSKLLGITVRTLRYYDNSGFIEAKRGNNQYRYYTGQQIDQIVFFKQLEKIGFTLLEISAIQGVISKDVLVQQEKKRVEQMKNLIAAITKLEEMIIEYEDVEERNMYHQPKPIMIKIKKPVKKDTIFQ